MPNLLLLKGQSRYNVLRYFTEELAAGLRNNNCQVEVLDLQEEKPEDVYARLEELRNDPPDAVIAFNGIVNDVIRKYLDVPYIGYMVDHPVIHHARYSEWASNDYAVCIDKTHADMIKKFYANVGDAFYIPHGGSEGTVRKPFSEREMDVVFCGSYSSSNQYLQELQSTLEPYEQQVAFILITRMQERNLSLEQALEEFLTENQIPFSNEEFTNLCLHYLKVDYFIRAFYREDLIRTLLANGVTVDIFGGNWNEFECENKEYLRIHEPLDYGESLDMFGNTKILLNSIPSFKAGGHERIFSAMLCGALCLTDPNIYLKEQFQDGEEIVYYNHDNMQSAANAVLYYLEYEAEAEKIVKAAYQIAAEKHTWESRARALLTLPVFAS